MLTESEDHDGHDHDHSHESSVSQTPASGISAEEFMNLTRFGETMHLRHVLDKSPGLVDARDAAGNTCMHWAARRGSVEILELLVSYGGDITAKASSETEMRPIHWACSAGHLAVVKYICNNNYTQVNIQDAQGCTPLCICAQYNHTPLVVFLLHIHADSGVCDSAQDTPAHWAAYKGHAEVLEVLCACASGYLDKEDVYGQTPLHLACIKGHTYVAQKLVKKYHASTAKKDKGGLTPLDHAVQKGHAQLEVTLRYLEGGVWGVVRGVGWRRMWKDKRLLLFSFGGHSDYAQSVWLWRVIFVSNFYATYMTLYYMMYSYPTSSHTPDHSPDHTPDHSPDHTPDTHTTDHTPAIPHTTTHTPVAYASYTITYLVCVYLVSLLVQAVWWVCFAGCLHTPPGFVEDGGGANGGSGGVGAEGDIEMPLVARAAPEKYMDFIRRGVAGGGEDDAGDGSGVSLCHTCQVRRPLRSKHCKVQDKCVCKFDHFCPYVYNTIGRDNYKYFFTLLCTHPMAYGAFVWCTYIYWMRGGKIGWGYVAFLVYSLGMLLLMLGLLNYHVSLVKRCLTTNEDINIGKYKYFWTEKRVFSNPFFHVSWRARLGEVFFPDTRLFFSRDEAEAAARASGTSSTSSTV